MKKWTYGLILFFMAVYIFPLGIRQIAMISEMRYGLVPAEMLASGDWIVPRLNGLRYFEKTPLGYWLSAAAMSVFGHHGFAVRLPSALSAGGTALLIFLMARAGTHSKRTALLAAAMYLTFLLSFIIGTTALLDSILTFFVTGVIATLYFACRAESWPMRLLHLVLCGVFLAASFMTKGFLAFAVPAITIIPWLIWQKEWKRIFTLPWIPLATAVLLILPWALAIAAREADFWPYFFWEEHVNRFVPERLFEKMAESEWWNNLLGAEVLNRLGRLGTQHEEPFLYFVPILLVGVLPWTLLLPSAFIGLWKSRRREPLPRLALCWFAFPLLFFSMSSGKLATYILPCFPPLALLGARGLSNYFGTGAKKTYLAGVWITAVLALTASVVLLAGHLTGFPVAVYEPDERLKLLLLLAGLLALAVLAAAAARPVDKYIRLTLFTLAPALLLVAAQSALPRTVKASESAENILMAHAGMAEGAILAGNRYTTHSVSFYFKRDDVYLFDSFGEFRYGLSYPEATHRHLAVEHFPALHDDPGRDRPIFMLLETRHYERYADLFAAYDPYTHSEGRLTVLHFP